MISVCGEALVDLTPTTVDGGPGYAALPGGSPFNVAVAVARLDVPARFLGRLSTDRFGVLLHDHLEGEGVDVREAPRGAEPTALAVVGLDEEGQASYRFLWDGTADRLLSLDELPNSLGESGWLHVGSVSTVLEPVATTVSELVDRERDRLLISFDPNVRPQFVEDASRYTARLEKQVSVSDLVKVSDEDLRWLHPERDSVETASRWVDRGPAFVIVTAGRDGATAIGPDLDLRVEGEAAEVVDTVGAGDSFMGALLAWLDRRGVADREALEALGPDDLREGLGFAVRCAAVTVSRPGADPPRRDEL